MTTNPTPDRYRCAEEADAMQWTGSNAEELRAFCGSDFDTVDPEDRSEDPDETAVVRSHKHGGWLGLTDGDWVVKHADHFSVASDEEFRGRWSPATPPCVSAVDQTTRDRIAEAVRRQAETGNVRYEAIADAVLAVLPPPADRAAVEVERDSLGREADRLRKDWVEMRTRAEQAEAERDSYGEQLDEAAETIAARTVEINRLTDELRRLADEAQQPSPRCTCGETVCESELCDCASEPCPVDHAAGARQPDTETPVVRHAPGKAVLCPVCRTKGNSVCTDGEEECCGAEPPSRADDPNSQWGDCWCTRPPGHDGEHRCEPCSERHGAPGWSDASAVPGRSAATSTDEETRS